MLASEAMSETSPTALDRLAAHLATIIEARPTVGVVLGSGLGAFGDQLEHAFPYDSLLGMPVSRVPGHAGHLRLGRVDDVDIACLQGRAHLYEGHSPGDVVFGVRLLARLGCRAVLLTNAAGGIAERLTAGARMLITDHLNLTGTSPLVGPHDPRLGPQFTDMGAAYDPRLRALAHEAAAASGGVLAEGVYAGLLGPSYETPAEIRMLRAMGADAVGMSTVLEVIALRQMGVRVGAISCITNLAAGLSPAPLDHADVQQVARSTSALFVALLSEWAMRVGREVAR